MKQKRFISLLLALCMMLGMAITSAYADTTDGITVNLGRDVGNDGGMQNGK